MPGNHGRTPEDYREAAIKGSAGRQNRSELFDPAPCPDCGQLRHTPETLRVHRWLAHGVTT